MKTPRHGWRWVCGRAVGTALIGLFSSLALPTHATTYYVNEGVGDNSYDGLSDVVTNGDGPKLNISSAITAAPDGGTIVVDSGYYQESIWDTGAASLTLDPQETVNICDADLCGADSVGDGIPDWWRLRYFGTPTTTNSDSCASCDPDRDGQTNLQEYQVGTDPTKWYSVRLPPAPCFTNLFIPDRTIIAIQPATNTFIFYLGESVIITSSAPTEVYRLTYGGGTTLSASGGTALTNTPDIGHYFVQSGNDRAEFAVLPSDYSTLDNVGHDDDYAEQYNNLSDRAKLGWVRVYLDWGVIQTNHGAAFNWGVFSNGISEISRLTNSFGKANIILVFGYADWATSYPFADWLTDYTNFVAAAYAQYGTNASVVRLDPLSEASGGGVNTNFNTGEYSALASQVYAAVAVAWPGVPQIGPSEDSIEHPEVPKFKAGGVDEELVAVDYHDYQSGSGVPPPLSGWPGDPDDLGNGVVARANWNLTGLGKTNVFVTELGLLGGSSLGDTNDSVYVNFGDCDGWCISVDSEPPFGWYRGLTRAMRTAVLYAQYRAVVLIHSFATGGPMDVTCLERNGVKPKISAFLMTSYWLNGATPLTNWVSGNFHFAESVWLNGMTNTFVWASEGTNVTTNLAVSVTDVWSNQWTGDIGEEPVIAWGWPPQ